MDRTSSESLKKEIHRLQEEIHTLKSSLDNVNDDIIQTDLKFDNSQQDLFEILPISIWEEDFSEVMAYLDKIEVPNNTDLNSYLKENKAILFECIQKLKILRVNQFTVDMFHGTSKQEVMNNFGNLMTKEALDRFTEELVHLYYNETNFTIESTSKTMSGDIIDVIINIQVPEKYRDTLERVYLTVQEITDIKNLERELIKKTERLQKAQKIGRMGFIDWNLKTDEVYLSNELADLLQLEKSKRWETSELINQITHPDEREEIYQSLLAAIRQENPHNMIHRLLRSDAKTFWVHAQAELLYYEDEDAQHLLGSVVDVTEREEAKRKMEQKEKELLVSQKMEAVGKLAGGIAHDFNNMLTIIVGNLELSLEEIDKDHQITPYLLEAKDAVNRSSTFINQLLTISRRRVGDPESLHIDTILLSTKELLQRTIREDIELRMDLNLEPDTLVRIDQANLEHLIINLTVNAREAMPSGGNLTIRTKITTMTNPGDSQKFAMIEFIDTGIGMDESVVARAFEPFFTTKDDGSGLGLSTVYGIVTSVDGKVEIESSPGDGTTIRTYFPVTDQ